MKHARILVIAILAAGLAAAAVAAGDPQPAAPAPANQSAPATQDPALVAPAAGLADIPENQAELEAARRGEMQLSVPEQAAKAAAPEALREARRAAFDAVISEQAAKVEALTARLAGAGAEEALAIQKQIEAEKKATDIRLLETQLQLATASGDQAAIAGAQAAIAEWNAPAPAAVAVDRPVPANPVR